MIAKQNYQEAMAMADHLTSNSHYNNTNTNTNANNNANNETHSQQSSENESDNENDSETNNNSNNTTNLVTGNATHVKTASISIGIDALSKQQQQQQQQQQNSSNNTNKSVTAALIDTANKDGNELDNDNDDYVSSDTSAEWFDGDEDSDSKAYAAGGYLRVRVGDLLNNRYLIEQKLGWGHFSTVWLALDKVSPKTDLRRRYVALKIQKSAQHYYEAARDEIELLAAAKEKNNNSSNNSNNNNKNRKQNNKRKGKNNKNNVKNNNKNNNSNNNDWNANTNYVAQMFDSFEVASDNGIRMFIFIVFCFFFVIFFVWFVSGIK